MKGSACIRQTRNSLAEIYNFPKSHPARHGGEIGHYPRLTDSINPSTHF
jgi:hypothetical protein